MKRFAILVAGGTGTRMQGTLPKQFMLLNGEAILAHTLRKFSMADLEIILVMHSEYISYWDDQCKTLFNIPTYRLVAGGNTRAESVSNGLSFVPENSLVAIHDAVRPLCSEHLILKLFEAGEKHGSAIPVLPCKETLRVITETGSNTVARENYRTVQTPQVFKSTELKKAFQKNDISQYTDEASVFENAGYYIHLEDGEESNIKITVPSDLIFASAFQNHL